MSIFAYRPMRLWDFSYVFADDDESFARRRASRL